MSVAKIIEVSSTSPRSFEDAIQQGISRAASTIHGIRSAWVKELRCDVQGNRITDYQVNMLLTFVLDDGAGGRGGRSAEATLAGTGGAAGAKSGGRRRSRAGGSTRSSGGATSRRGR